MDYTSRQHMIEADEKPSANDYPRAAIPLKPPLAWATWRPGSAGGLPSLLDASDVLPVTSGRSAIALALRHMGVTPGDQVLVPAYHCTAMIDPIAWAGAVPVFYRIRSDASIDAEDVARRINSRVRALLVVHYFGFPQDMRALRTLCDQHGLVLIEDCAHALFGRFGAEAPGTHADYAIASAMKFFPIYDGGYLTSRRRRVRDIPLDAAAAAFEIKSLFNTLEYAIDYRRLLLLKPVVALKNAIWRRLKDSRATAATPGPGASDGDYAFDPAWLSVRMSLASRFVIATASRARIVRRRRAHYLALHRAFAELDGCRPLFPQLPEGVAPYVYPLLIDEPERIFPALKRDGVPIVRFGEFLWPGVDALTCAVSADLSRRLFQFPVHQELRGRELAWMIERVRAVLTPPAAPRGAAIPATTPTAP